jgi:triosephosphate isomerase
MNKTIEGARGLVRELLPGLMPVAGVEKVLCPPFTSLMTISDLLKGSDIGLGAQDMHWKEAGAYTGEVSPEMVKECCRYVIIGHSERRAYFGETDEHVNLKVKAALAVGLTPIVCVGETLEENESGRTREVVEHQVAQGLAGLTALDVARLVIAYEPVWAIGTGRAATGEVANQVVAAHIRTPLVNLANEEVAGVVRVLYGGSVTGANATEFFSQPEIDGALVGGASLKPVDFIQIVTAAAA